MENAGYVTLTRQSGLMREMQVVAHNIANLSTTGFRAEGVIFAEHVRATGRGEDSLSMATAAGHSVSPAQGTLRATGGTFDFAIEGDGFFLVQTPQGEALTRAGSFIRSDQGELVTPDGHRLLDAGGAPVFVPATAASVMLADDGTLSADGQPLTQIGLWQPVDPTELSRRAGVLFEAPSGVAPAPPARLLQGVLEQSNVDPVGQIARMIEVQRAYELGQSFLDAEDNRLREFLRTAGSRG
ncbi:Flagellar basal-body rod protein FlgG [Roseibacterium elongatum DSM 19469]|uniref:Flagellar basal-body rod protein FlgF n=1 Tax=Roseicyclus elongatus DSM 19469 TaxID=1294273 RepID=W8RRJ6_9RHOB|nr:flagellar hook-basal body complex protein [Roseibacterium elongatum]AHM03708.1 Flagellar basal-body rod protein FlgG [Roseibacterium elongatum DSM 19469]